MTYPLCTIASKPRLPEHCIEYVKVLLWSKEKPFGGNCLYLPTSMYVCAYVNCIIMFAFLKYMYMIKVMHTCKANSRNYLQCRQQTHWGESEPLPSHEILLCISYKYILSWTGSMSASNVDDSYCIDGSYCITF